MKALILAAALTLSAPLILASPAFAQSPEAVSGPLTDVGSVENRTFLVAGDPVARNGRSTIWLWHVYHEPQSIGDVQIDARAERIEIDCTARTMTRTRWENYTGTRLHRGGDMDSGPLHAAPGNETERMVAVGCGQDYPGKGQGLKFATLEAAIAGLR